MQRCHILALLALASCSEGTIGKELCIGVKCDEQAGLMVEQLAVDFEEVTTHDPGALPKPSWRLPNSCVGCADTARIFPARDGAVWSVVSGASLPTVEWIAPDGTRSMRTLEAPDAASTLLSAYFTAESDGSLLAHLQWSQPSTRSYDETVQLVDATQPPQRITLDPASTQPRPPAVVRSAQGFLLFDDGVARENKSFNVVRNVANDGEVVWQQGSFPSAANVVGGSAVATSASYVLAAYPNIAGASAYRMLWLDPMGTVRRVTEIIGSTWRGLSFFDRGGDRYVAVAPSDVTAAGNGSTGNIDLVFFDGAWPTGGIRLRRDCFYELALHGFAIDRDGNAFVSSIVGLRDNPRGLLCQLPASRKWRCYQTEPQQVLGALVALDEDSVIAVLNDEIVRFDLP